MNSKYSEKEFTIFKVFFFIMPFLWGLYYEHAVYAVEAVLWALLLVRMVQKKKVVFLTGMVPYVLYLFVIMSFLSLFWAVDTGMAFSGVMKFMIVIPFIYLVADYTESKRLELLRLVPLTGSVMTVVCGVCYFTPLKDVFFKAERLGGFFQYSNTFALYLLIGLLVLFGFNQKLTKKMYIEATVLLVGIFLTGSRTTFILLSICVLGFVWVNRKNRQGKVVFGGSVLCVCGVFVALLLTGNSQLFGRFLTISWKNSTFLGRLLYYKDALGMIVRHPFGLGFQGYSYVHPYEQTGVYSIRYVHNDWLQLALDVGIVILVLAVVVFALCLADKKMNKTKKYILLCIGVHSLLEFDLQFVVIVFIVLLCMNYEKMGKKTSGGMCTAVSAAISGLIGTGCLILTLAFGAFYLGNFDMALKLYPCHTEVKIAKVRATEDIRLAKEVTEDNSYVLEVYRFLAKTAYENKKYDEMITYERQWLKGCRYDMEAYEECLLSISTAIEESIQAQDYETAEGYIEFALELDMLLEETKAQTSSLAWMIKDKPDLTWSENYQEYLKVLESSLR